MDTPAERSAKDSGDKALTGQPESNGYAGRSLLFAAIGIGIFGAAVYFIGWDGIVNAIVYVPPQYFVLLCLLEALTEWGRALKWRVALGREARAVSLFFLSKAGGNLSPARLGEFLPLVFPLYRSTRVGAWILTDRVIEALSTIFLGCCGLLFIPFQKVVSLELEKFRLVFWGSATLLLVVCAAVFFLSLHFAKRFVHRTPLRVGGVEERLLRVLSEFRVFWKQIPLLSSLTLLFTAIDVFAGVFLYAAFGFAVSFWVVAVASALHGIVSISPVTPSATGIPYVAAGTILHMVGGVTYEAIAGAVVVHLVIVNLIFWGSTGLALLFSKGFCEKC